MMGLGWITSPVGLIRTRYMPSYFMLNLLFYGFIGLGMIIVVQRPAIQTSLTRSVQKDMQSPKWAPVVNSYSGRHVFRAAAITFAVNFFAGTLIEMNLPSLIIPFIGIGIGIFRAILWGLIFGPGPGGSFHVMATHWPVMVLEGQGYVLGMLSVYIHGKGVVKPDSVMAVGWWQGYKRGLLASVRIYPLIALILAVSAVYEAIEVSYFVHR